MKKILLSSLLALAVQPTLYADENSAEKAVEKVAAEAVEKVETTAAAAEAKMTLPKAEIVDADMDMEDTMKKMKKAFKKLGKADDISEMVEPAKSLATYASQSVALAEKSDHEKKADLINGLTKMRERVATLNDHVAKGDFKAAKKMVKALNKQRKKAHKYFDVD